MTPTLANNIELGDTVRDKTSGFTGKATSVCFYEHQCCRVAIQPMVGKDGKLPDAMMFDILGVEVVKKAKPTPKIPEAKKTGGPSRTDHLVTGRR